MAIILGVTELKLLYNQHATTFLAAGGSSKELGKAH